MNISDVKKVCVVGTGKMGTQIALNCAIHGFETVITGRSLAKLEDIKTWSDDYLKGRVSKGKLTEEQATKAADNFKYTTDLKQAVSECQIIFESVVEDKEIKKQIFTDINSWAMPDAVIASNSSYMPSSEFSEYITNPGRLANAHFFHPALAMKLVEVIKGEHTSEDTIEILMDFAKATGKTPIRVNKEIDGFVVNRVLRAIRDEAFFLIEEGVVSPQDLDIGVELGLNHPMGPFKLLDFTGVDLMYRSSEKRWKDTGIKPHGYDIVKEMYENNEWGRKTGKGFYDYEQK